MKHPSFIKAQTPKQTYGCLPSASPSGFIRSAMSVKVIIVTY